MSLIFIKRPILAWVLRRIARQELQVLQRLASEIGQRDGSGPIIGTSHIEKNRARRFP